MKLLLVISILFAINPVYSENNLDEEIFVFRMNLKDKKFTEAEALLAKFGNTGIDEPKYELLETELWIAKAEDLYSKKQFKSAFPFYNNAYVRWRTNPLLKERFKELSGKILTDELETPPKLSRSLYKAPEVIQPESPVIEKDPISNIYLYLITERISMLERQVLFFTNAFYINISVTVILLILFLFKRKL